MAKDKDTSKLDKVKGGKSDENKELKHALSEIEKTFGKGSIMSLGDIGAIDVECISTGSLGLDIALGGKGLPRGRVIEAYGAEASGKTTVALHTVAQCQKNGGTAAYIDAEHALDPSWAKKLGVDLDNLLVSQPSYGEEGLRIAEMLIKSNAVDLIVVDSVAALVPKNEMEDSDIGDTKVGLQARLMSQALRILNPQVNKSKTCLFFINQIRQKIGVMYGDPNTTTGGLALKFYASVRMEVKRITHVKDGEEIIGSETRVRVVKNKIAPPFRNAEFNIVNDRGIDYEGEVLAMGVEDELIEKASGARFMYKDQQIGHGEKNAILFLRDNIAIRDELAAAIKEKRIPKVVDAAALEATAAKDEAEAAAELAAIGEEVEAAPKKKRGKAAAE